MLSILGKVRLSYHKILNEDPKDLFRAENHSLLKLNRIGWNESLMIDLSGSSVTCREEWFNPETGEAVDGGVVTGGRDKYFTAPPLAMKLCKSTSLDSP
jgi:hypothetical protein